MNELTIYVLFLFPVIVFLFTGWLSEKKNNKLLIKGISKVIPFFSIIISTTGVFWLYSNGAAISETIGINGLGFSLRIDSLSLIMYSMVSIIALVVLRFSYSYLDGDPHHHKFIARLAVTIALVQLMVISGNIVILFVSWVATSIALHQLLIFYPERYKAKLAAKKKFFLARIGDILMLTAFSLIYFVFQTGNLDEIFAQAKILSPDNIPFQLEIAVLLLVITAALKSVQFPFHAWILDVMEAPTPVSALLHAGLLNAGPFLIIRFSFVFDTVYYAPIVLFIIGTFTAMFGALVFITQPNIKTALAYSSIGHMGFTLMICGLGVYSASLLHLVSHSFYKAHSFLSVGSVLEKVRTKHASNYERKGSVLRVLIGITITVLLFLSVSEMWSTSFNHKHQLMIIGGIIFTGIVSLLINAVDSTNYLYSIIKILGAASLVLIAYYTLEEGSRYLLGSQIPKLSEPGITMKYISTGALILFFTTVVLQTLSPFQKGTDIHRAFGVHLRNGLYINLLADQLVTIRQNKNAKNKPLN